MTLVKNNPDIDYDILEKQINQTVELLNRCASTDTTETANCGQKPDVLNVSESAESIGTLDDLYRLNDREFIRAAYIEFLKREPDPDGEQHYLQLLREGLSKRTLCAILRNSPAGRTHEQRFNLKKEWILFRLTRVPLLGKIIDTVVALAGITNIKKSLLAMQQQLAVTQETVHRQNQALDRFVAEFVDDLNAMEYEANQHRLSSFAQLQQQLIATEFKLEQDIRALRLSAANTQRHIEGRETEQGPLDTVDRDFYHRFEEHFRGPQSLVKERLGSYLPHIERKLDGSLLSGPCLDIGCGRGEWLKILKDSGYPAMGIDLDHTNVQNCIESNLNVELADALTWLRSRNSNSLALITAFHVVEHLSFNDLNQLMAECLRTLSPGGLIILETPNPENLITAAHQFYLDPTHKSPLPPELLRFLAEYRGFSDIEILRLHPSRNFSSTGSGSSQDDINNILFGPQDYALIAKK